MPLYLWKVSYTPDGTKGLTKDGGSKRRDFVKGMVEKLGGKLHSFYYALGRRRRRRHRGISRSGDRDGHEHGGERERGRPAPEHGPRHPGRNGRRYQETGRVSASRDLMPRRAAKVRPFVEANADYERWLGARLRLRRGDLERKHAAMAESRFPFLRATFYRWAERWPAICPELLEAPRVLAIGDLHVENFGTWRDLEGRLVWGINDYDEAWPLPYPNDLVRLMTSVVARDRAPRPRASTPEATAEAILRGYAAAPRRPDRNRSCWPSTITRFMKWP